jgi:restriction system protein
MTAFEKWSRAGIIFAIGDVRIGDAVDRLADQLNLTPEDRVQLLHSGKQTLLGNRVRWAKTYFTKAGLLESTRRGHFRITERGLQVVTSHPSPIDNKFFNQFAEFRQFKEKSANDAAQGAQLIEPPLVSRAETPDEVMRAAHKQVEISLGWICSIEYARHRRPSSSVSSSICCSRWAMAAPPRTRDGQSVAAATTVWTALSIKTHLGSIASIFRRNAMRLVTASAPGRLVRDFFGSLDRHKATKGLFVTTSTFSPSAKETTEFLGKRIVLIDGENLAKLMIRYSAGCRIEEVLHIKKVDEDFFE